MSKILDLKEMPTPDLEAMLANKNKAVTDLNVWLSRHDSREPEYRRVSQDVRDMDGDIKAIETELNARKKSLNRSLSQMKL